MKLSLTSHVDRSIDRQKDQERQIDRQDDRYNPLVRVDDEYKEADITIKLRDSSSMGLKFHQTRLVGVSLTYSQTLYWVKG